jgi:hypothetical protein
MAAGKECCVWGWALCMRGDRFGINHSILEKRQGEKSTLGGRAPITRAVIYPSNIGPSIGMPSRLYSTVPPVRSDRRLILPLSQEPRAGYDSIKVLQYRSLSQILYILFYFP